MFFVLIFFKDAADIAEIYFCVGNRGSDGHQVFLDKDAEKDYKFDESDNWEGFSILKYGGIANSGK